MAKIDTNKLKYLIKKNKNIKEITEELKENENDIIAEVIKLKDKGLMVDYVNGDIIKLKRPPQNDDVYQIPYDLDYLQLCLISDTHLCSKYDRLDILNYIYEKADKRNIKHILHSGDFTDGKSNRPEHIYELKELSYLGQAEYCIEKYPRLESTKTYVIQGNHDDWWYKSAGSEIVKSIAKEREDIIYLGSGYADLKIGKLKIRLFHGKGSPAYAKSYKIQKYIDQIPIEERPAILQTGHIHQSFYMKQDDTHCFQVGCLQDLTPYAKNMGFADDKSCWWLDIGIDKKGKIIELHQELETFKKRVRKR